MAFKDMKLTKREAKKLVPVEATSADRPKYPWGLQITFDRESLKKLGKSVDDFDVGQRVTFVCIAKVTSLSKRDNESGEGSQDVTLQIQKINMGDSKTGGEK